MADPDGDVDMHDQEYNYDDEFAGQSGHEHESPASEYAGEIEGGSDDDYSDQGDGLDGMADDQSPEEDEGDSSNATEDVDVEAGYGRLVSHMNRRRTGSNFDENIDPNLDASTGDHGDDLDPEIMEALDAGMSDVPATMRSGWRRKGRRAQAAERLATLNQLYSDADLTKTDSRGHVISSKRSRDSQDPLDYTRHLPKGMKPNSIEAAKLGAYNLIPEHDDVVFPNGKRAAPALAEKARRRSSQADQASSAPAIDPTLTDAVEQWNKSMSFWSTQPARDLGFAQDATDLDPDDLSGDDEEMEEAPMPDGEHNDAGDRSSAPRDDESYVESGEEDDEGGDADPLTKTPVHPYFAAVPQTVAAASQEDDSQQPEQSDAPQRPTRGRGSRGPRRARGGRKDGSGPRRGRGGWKQFLAGTEHDPKVRKREEQKAERRRRKEIAKRTGVPLRRGRVRREHLPSRECKSLMGQAAEAVMEGDLDTALRCAQAAIPADPEAYDAHSLLSDILAKMGRLVDARSALQFGAESTKLRNVEKWLDIAQRTIDLDDSVEPTRETLKQAIWAYGRAGKCSNYSTDPELKYAILVGKRDVHAALGNVKDAKREAYKAFTIHPEVMDNARVYAELCVQTGYAEDIEHAVQAYETAFHQHKGKDSFAETVEEMWSHVNIFVELLDKMGPKSSMKGTYWLKLLARWILGRKDEAFWDLLQDDDREFDIENERRGYVPEFQQGRATMDKSKYGSGLPLELRVKLGLFRLKMGYPHHPEAMKHLEFLLLLSDDVAEYYDLFLSVADTCMHYFKWEMALKLFDAVNEGVEVTEDFFFLEMAKCHRQLNHTAEAEEIYLRLIREKDDHLLARVDLAKLYESSGQPEKAFEMMRQVRKFNNNRLEILARHGLLPQGKKQSSPRAGLAKRPTQPLKSIPSATGPGTYEHFWQNATNVRAGADAPPLRTLAAKPLASGGSDDPDAHSSTEPNQGRKPRPVPSFPARPKARRLFDPKHDVIDKVQARIERIARDEGGVRANFSIVRELWPVLEDGTEDADAVERWMTAATKLVDTFRKMDVFYPQGSRLRRFGGYTSVKGRGDWGRRKKGKPQHLLADDVQREAQKTIDRLQPNEDEDEDLDMTAAMPEPSLDTPLNFHGIAFDEWHRVFVDLALLHAKRADQAACYDLLKGGMFYCNVFIYDWSLHRITIAAALLCALMFNDTDLVGDMARHFINKSDYRSGSTYQLLATSVRLCHGDWSTQGATQKFLHRMMKLADYNLLPQEIRKQLNYEQKSSVLENRRLRIGDGTGQLDAGILMLYGSMLFYGVTRNSNPLAYYLRALAIEPDNYSIHLAIGINYLHHAMKRMTDNRQTQIQQGLSFLSRYRALRVASGRAAHVQEAEYNVARAHHMVGLTHLAVPGYEVVLQYSQAVREEAGEDEAAAEDFAKEAAYALQQILALAGNQEAAMGVTEEYLVI
ncbi:transcription factor tau subunit sfc4-like [Teratosphaeria destructans]|uniref:Transcription factor tau subunit sfc4-like n=1 Tax=Teratosphaeria destructans TaxID=418781 RepID=A0A9W7SQR1_9PEZI|nr:transcription factor tau subunit sfc4-like [Teratosphaeria destructans]